MYLAQFAQGFKHTFMYMLRDAGGSDAGYGMFLGDYRPKLSATYLHNMTTILADDGDGVTASGRLNYTIQDPPATVHDLLLQKSNGTFMLIVWNERAQGSNDVTVNLSSARPWVKVYDPTIGVASIKVLKDARFVSLTLSDHPVILEME
jgi:hypothetical protein